MAPVLCEVSSGKWNPPADLWLTGERSARIRGFGFEIGGRADNYHREFPAKSVTDLRRRLPRITCVVCEKFLERFSDEARDVRTSRMDDAGTVTQLIFRTYHQHQGDQWTARALDLIDRLCLEGIGDARKEFDAFER